MKIIFVETPSPWLVRQDMHVALGPLYLATILKKEGYDVRLARPKRKEDFVNFRDADIICMSGTTLEYPMNVECAVWTRKHFPDMKILFGGTHATAMHQDVSESGLFDAIGVGEGELIILDMVRDAERGELKKIYFSNGFAEDLDAIPFPDRTLIEGSYGRNIFVNRKSYISGGSESLITSRGCSFNCAFCASHSMWNGRTRYRSTENIVSEIRQIVESTGIRQFGMWDDNLTLNRKRCLKLCGELKELDIAWRCLVRADRLDSEICEAMAIAGCKEIWPGIESGDQRVLDFLDKRIDREKMLEGCRNAKKAGLKIKALFMIGTPGERIDTPELNREYIRRLDFDMITLSTFTPLPGSPVWNDPDRYNCEILSRDFRKYNQYYWVMKNGKKIKREYEPMIHNKLLTIEQMKGNVERMATYVEETGKYNRG
ncbi:Anaerobic magnesium-protoporphyrin IX monomethyl ester cyclase [subsurface metagenome]